MPVAAPPPPDLSAVPEPAGLLVVGRVAQPEKILKTVGGWVHLPLPGANELLKSLGDETFAEVADLSQSVDGVVAVGSGGGGMRDFDPQVAFAVSVRSFEQAKAKLGAKYTIKSGPNGQFTVEGIGAPPSEPRDGNSDDDEPKGLTCALAPAVGGTGAKLVCGERASLEALVPYMTRTLPRASFGSDVHVEFRFAPVREPMAQLRTTLPVLGRSLGLGGNSAISEMIDAGLGEVADFVNDATRMTFDSDLSDPGAQATTRVDYATSTSLMARVAAASLGHAGPPPAAFMHLPGDTDVALYGLGSDPKLLDRPRELIGKALLSVGSDAKMPDAESRTLRDLLADRLLGLFAGQVVYGKGFDQAAVERALSARDNVKQGDAAAEDEASRVLAEQVVGWHLVQVSEPVTKVGPMLKDWAQLWNRPAFAKWLKANVSAKKSAQVRLAAMPAGVKMPKDAVHLEIVIPRSDLEVMPPMVGRPGGPMPKAKKIARKPVVLHVMAIPDQGATWLAFGLDAKLAATKALQALSTAPEDGTLGKTGALDELKSSKLNGAWLMTLRGLLVFTALDHGERSPFRALGSLAHKGTTPILFTFKGEGPDATGAAGHAVSTFKVPKAAIEDVVRAAMSSIR